MADVFLSYGVRNVVIKLGDRGCFVKNHSECGLIDAFPSEAVDTTGAGDNFAAGFIKGILQGWDIRECARFANAAGALAVRGIGATSGVRSMEQVLEYMKNPKDFYIGHHK